MAPPFSADDFFGVFTAYNEAVWPAQIVLFGLGVSAVVLAFARPAWHGRVIYGILASLWLWMGVTYHWIFFSRINPAAPFFAVLFVAEGALLARAALGARGLDFRPDLDANGWAGGALIAYALVVYPLLGFASGRGYPAQPTFGLPCPTTILTLGLLLWARPRSPHHLLLIPVSWAVVGSTAVRYFGVLEDAMLPLAAVAAAGLALRDSGRSRRALRTAG